MSDGVCMEFLEEHRVGSMTSRRHNYDVFLDSYWEPKTTRSLNSTTVKSRSVSVPESTTQTSKELRAELKRMTSQNGRAQSIDSQHDSAEVMRRITAENVDLRSTPLLKSCSDFSPHGVAFPRKHTVRMIPHRDSLDDVHEWNPLANNFFDDNEFSRQLPPKPTVESRKKRGVWRSLVSFFKSKKHDTRENSTCGPQRMALSLCGDGAREYLVECLKFHRENLMEGEEDYVCHGERDRSTSSSSTGTFLQKFGKRHSTCTEESESTHITVGRSLSVPAQGSKGMFDNSNERRESRDSMLEICFGVQALNRRFDSTSSAAEIELNCIAQKPLSRMSTLSRSCSLRSDGDAGEVSYTATWEDSVHSADGEILSVSGYSSRADINAAVVVNGSSIVTGVQPEPEFLNMIQETSRPYFSVENLSSNWIRALEVASWLLPTNAGDSALYDSIRVQPFSSGAYLRGMLLSGFSATCFQVINFFGWPSPSPAENVVGGLISTVYWLLVGQVVCHLIQLPCRLHIHYMCWESSRTLDAEAATTIIRRMLMSDSWLFNKILGRLSFALAILSLLIVEYFVWTVPEELGVLESGESLHSFFVTLSATTLLSIVSRTVVSLAFSASMTNPVVLSEARKRGLTKIDIAALPSFTFRAPRKNSRQHAALASVCITDCAICLENFDDGDRLTCLPCDNKHNFHTSCIQQWLERQNSCPLCQRVI